MKKNLSLRKFNSEKYSARKLRKCEMELAAILLQLCAIFGHTRHGIFIRGIYLLNLEGYFSLSIFYWFVSDRNNLNNLRSISK